MNLNKVILMGRIGKDAEVFHFDNGSSVAKFSLATTDYWRDAQGEKKEKTQWHNVALFGKYADKAAQHLKKGAGVLIEGKIEYREYEKDGQKRYATEIKAESYQMVAWVKDESQQPESKPSQSTIPIQSPQIIPLHEAEEDLPF